ncbi:unnamed protein product [Phyllotreta striolata]|uniref:DNA 3'-5' helicase n=1 Tax=Phyllotreta striolata TaxID=444603 RepID=A0A9N9TNG4_PHYSR|nr:unnamed protein product [Phyllotreta striolata]
MNALNLKHIDEIPARFRGVFSEYVCFNAVQSKVLPSILYSNESIVVSAPTGSGKTVIFELGIVKLLMDYEANAFEDFKIVYISPLKSLCQERVVDWNRKFSPFGVSIVCATGESDNLDYHTLINHNLIISTPEKWDVLTRKWRDNELVVRAVKLFMIDEVHLLNEDDRGSTLEVIVSRMKTIQNYTPNREDETQMRFMAVSATIGNVEDIAQWLGCRNLFNFPSDARPVPLKTIVLGYSSPIASVPFKFDLSLNYRLQNLIIQHAEGKPTLIFCSTRKSVDMTAKHLKQTLKIQINPLQARQLIDVSESITDNKIKDVIKHGIGVHHAGMPNDTRYRIESAFREGHLPILVTTSTLAMGVNLPAHLVIIKSTKFYANGNYQDYSATAINQMIGRAGRIQFDTSATAIILTTNDSKKKVEKQINCNEPVESNLHKHLTEHLNAEVVLGTINGLEVAMQWLASTFLYIRARKNPKYYGLPVNCNQQQLDKKLLEMFQIDLNKLVLNGMIEVDEYINVKPTSTGRLMARYYVDFQTMKMFTQLNGNEVIIQLLALISKCQEFSEIRLRVNDKKTLNLLNRNSKKQSIRFPLKGKIKTWDMKVNCIIQATLGNLEITDYSIQNESYTIIRNSERIVRCLIDYMQMRKPNCYNALYSAIILGKCLKAKLWENSPYVSKQLTGIGSTSAAQLTNAGKDTFEKLAKSNARELELNIKRKPPFGNYLLEEVRGMPKYSMYLERYHQDHLKVTIKLRNVDDVREKCTVTPSSRMTLLVGTSLNEVLLHEDYLTSYLIANPEITKFVKLLSLTGVEFIKAHFISDNWVGIDCNDEYRFDIDNNRHEPSKTGQNFEAITEKKRSSYMQSYLDMYLNVHKPENTSLQEIPKNNQKLDKIPAKIRSENCNDVKEKLSLSNNISDSELNDLLEDYKIITAYKNVDTTVKECSSVENVDEIIYTSNEIQDYEEIISSAVEEPEADEEVSVNITEKSEGNQQTENCADTDNKKDSQEAQTTDQFSMKSEEYTNELNLLTSTNPVLFVISQKYLTDITNQDHVGPLPSKSQKKNDTLRNILNFRSKRKKKTDDLHPAEILEDQLIQEEYGKKSGLEVFKKPQKRKMNNDEFSNSMAGPSYKITEISEPSSSKHADYYTDNHKNIKWKKSPVIPLSPKMKFSPKRSHSKKLSRRSSIDDNELLHDGHNELFEHSKHSPVNTLKPSKRRQKSSNKDEYESVHPILKQFSDLCSAQLLLEISKPRKSPTVDYDSKIGNNQGKTNEQSYTNENIKSDEESESSDYLENIPNDDFNEECLNNASRTPSEEYSDTKLNDNYAFCADLEPPMNKYPMTAPHAYPRNYNATTPFLNAPESSNYCYSYADRMQPEYYPKYGPVPYNYPASVVRRSFTQPEYLEYNVRPSIRRYNNVPVGFPSNYPEELPHPMQLSQRQRIVPNEDYMDFRRPNIHHTSSQASSNRHLYVENDLDRSFPMRNVYNADYLRQSFPSPPASRSQDVYFPGGQARRYEYDSPEFPDFDKEYGLKKYWGSLDNQ